MQHHLVIVQSTLQQGLTDVSLHVTECRSTPVSTQLFVLVISLTGHVKYDSCNVVISYAAFTFLYWCTVQLENLHVLQLAHESDFLCISSH